MEETFEETIPKITSNGRNLPKKSLLVIFQGGQKKFENFIMGQKILKHGAYSKFD